MVLDRPALKQRAKSIVKGARVSAYLFTLLYLGISLVINGADTYISGGVGGYFAQLGLSVPAWLRVPEFPGLLVTFVSVAVWLLTVLLQGGCCLYHLGVNRGQRRDYGTLLDGFAFAGKLIWLNLVMTVFVALWTMLFVIPGFVAAYRYRFAVYNLCENTDLGAMAALRMSKAQTAGFKWQLFVLDLSFFGWSLLSVLTLGILSIWINPYYQQSDVMFYRTICAFKGIDPLGAPEDGGQFRPTDTF